jgi:hypothetical protein
MKLVVFYLVSEVKEEWIYTFTPPYLLMAWGLIKHNDSFTFAFIHKSIDSDTYYLVTLFQHTERMKFVRTCNYYITPNKRGVLFKHCFLEKRSRLIFGSLRM